METSGKRVKKKKKNVIIDIPLGIFSEHTNIQMHINLEEFSLSGIRLSNSKWRCPLDDDDGGGHADRPADSRGRTNGQRAQAYYGGTD